MKLNQFLIISFTLLILIAGTVSLYYTYTKTNQFAQETLYNNLEAIAISRADNIQNYLESNMQILSVIQAKKQLRQTLAEYLQTKNPEQKTLLQKNLLETKLAINNAKSITIADFDGNTIISTNPEEKNAVDNPCFKEALTKNTQIYQSLNNKLTLCFGGPITILNTPLAIILLEIDDIQIHDILTNYDKLGETGETLLLSTEGKLMMRPRFAPENYQELRIKNENFLACLEDKKIAEQKGHVSGHEHVLIFNDYRNQKVIGTHYYIPEIDACLVAKQNAEETVFAVQKLLYKIIIFTLSLFVIIAVIGAIIISTYLGKQIKTLTNEVAEITTGNLEITLSPSKINEIQELTNSLNRILASLKLAILRTGMTKQQLGIGEIIKAKKEIEQKYQTLYETSKDAIMLLEPPSWKFTAGNPATIEMFKAKNEKDFTSRAPWEYSPSYQPDGKPSAKKAKEMINLAMKKGSHSFEWVHKRLNGEEFPATVLLTRIQLDHKTLLQATVRDITERKKIESQLQTTLLEQKTILSNTNDFIYKHDTKGKFKYLSPAIKQITGFTPEEWKNINYKKILTENPINKNVITQTQTALKTGRQGLRYLAEVYGKTKQKIMLEINEKPYFENGKVAGIIGVARNVTKENGAEQRIKEVSNERQLILDHIPEMIFYKDTKNNILQVNKAFTQAMGLKKEKIENKNVCTLWPKNCKKYFEADKQLIKTRKPKLGIIEPMRVKKGIVTVLTDKIPIKNEKGEVIGVLGVTRELPQNTKKTRKA